jgi:hypothetical protein
MLAEPVRVGGVVTRAELDSDRLPRVLARYPLTLTLAVPEPLKEARTMLAVPEARAEPEALTVAAPSVMLAVAVPPPPPSSRPKTSTAPSRPTSDLSSEVAIQV